jgi:hypothetical protein
MKNQYVTLLIGFLFLGLLFSGCGNNENKEASERNTQSSASKQSSPPIVKQSSPKPTEPEYDGIYAQMKNGDFIELKEMSRDHGRCIREVYLEPNRINRNDFRRIAVKGIIVGEFKNNFSKLKIEPDRRGRDINWFCKTSNGVTRSKKIG